MKKEGQNEKDGRAGGGGEESMDQWSGVVDLHMTITKERGRTETEHASCASNGGVSVYSYNVHIRECV